MIKSACLEHCRFSNSFSNIFVHIKNNISRFSPGGADSGGKTEVEKSRATVPLSYLVIAAHRGSLSAGEGS
jgi:hypothetical protein